MSSWAPRRPDERRRLAPPLSSRSRCRQPTGPPLRPQGCPRIAARRPCSSATAPTSRTQPGTSATRSGPASRAPSASSPTATACATAATEAGPRPTSSMSWPPSQSTSSASANCRPAKTWPRDHRRLSGVPRPARHPAPAIMASCQLSHSDQDSRQSQARATRPRADQPRGRLNLPPSSQPCPDPRPRSGG